MHHAIANLGRSRTIIGRAGNKKGRNGHYDECHSGAQQLLQFPIKISTFNGGMHKIRPPHT